jgi:hypothetical protein
MLSPVTVSRAREGAAALAEYGPADPQPVCSPKHHQTILRVPELEPHAKPCPLADAAAWDRLEVHTVLDVDRLGVHVLSARMSVN